MTRKTTPIMGNPYLNVKTIAKAAIRHPIIFAKKLATEDLPLTNDNDFQTVGKFMHEGVFQSQLYNELYSYPDGRSKEDVLGAIKQIFDEVKFFKNDNNENDNWDKKIKPEMGKLLDDYTKHVDEYM